MRIVLSALVLFFLFPAGAQALVDGEIAAGVWFQSPEGDVAVSAAGQEDKLDVEDELEYDDEAMPVVRARLGLPLLFPDLSLMYTPVDFDETGSRETSFTFGDETFQEDVPFDSELTMQMYDVALFYEIPLLRKATLGTLALDLGVNVRMVDFEVSLEQSQLGIEEEESAFVPIPMIYAGVRLSPYDRLFLEGEFRGITYEDDSAYSILGRIKYMIWNGLFAAGGYRYDSVDVDEDDVEVDVSLQGPFAEVGFAF